MFFRVIFILLSVLLTALAQANQVKLLNQQLHLQNEFQFIKANGLGFIAYVGDKEQVKNFFQAVVAEFDTHLLLELQFRKIIVQDTEFVLVNFVSATLTVDQMLEIQKRFENFVTNYRLGKKANLKISGSWVVLNEDKNFQIMNSNFDLKDFKKTDLFSLDFAQGIGGKIGEDSRLFFNANEDWHHQIFLDEKNEEKARMINSKGREVLDPLRAQAELGVKFNNNILSVRSAFHLQPLHDFNLKHLDRVSINYRGLFLFYSKEL